MEPFVQAKASPNHPAAYRLYAWTPSGIGTGRVLSTGDSRSSAIEKHISDGRPWDVGKLVSRVPAEVVRGDRDLVELCAWPQTATMAAQPSRHQPKAMPVSEASAIELCS
jgi:hypothetical protein